jgi:hypothetical protein
LVVEHMFEQLPTAVKPAAVPAETDEQEGM